jgi:hypothetical protein
MKKILAILVLLSAVLVMVAPAAVVAQEELPKSCTIKRDTGIDGCPLVGETSTYDTKYKTVTGAICCLMSSIYYVTDWVFTILVIMSVFIGIMGGFTMVTAGGNPENVTKGRNYMMYAVIGVGIAFIAKAIPSIAKAMMGI